MGASRRGVDMGPSAMRVAGLEARLEALGHSVTDGGNIRVEVAETRASGNKNAHYITEIAETCARTAEAVIATLEEGGIPLVLGGDHSLAAGSISGVSEFYRRRGQKIGVIWIDAHSDINTPESSPSGNVHGMPLAALLGLGRSAISSATLPKWPLKTPSSSASATSMPPSAKTSAAPASLRSTPCAISTSAA
jgi:arginase